MLPPDIQDAALIKLKQLDNVSNLWDLRYPPRNRLEKLVGNRERQHRIRINSRWRVCFEWFEGDAWEFEITDYH